MPAVPSPSGALKGRTTRLQTLLSKASASESCQALGRTNARFKSTSRCRGHATRPAASVTGSQQTTSPVPQVADLEDILAERDACGVGFIANLQGERSHKIMSEALQALGCMEHRGACSADNDSGDGAGVMSHIPWKLIQKSFPAAEPGSCGVGMVFLPNEDAAEATSRKIAEECAAAEGLEVLGWREVPVQPSVVGRIAEATMPRVAQLVVKDSSGRTGADLERALYLSRKAMERRQGEIGERGPEFYLCSMSGQTIIYKGMLRSVVLGAFYQDLTDPDFDTAFAIYHRRFSTNTNPKWPLAQPMRVLGHNGEINTVQGNVNWMASRQGELTHPVWGGRENDLLPVCRPGNSDSGNLDNTAELLVRTGEPIDKSLMVLVPEAYDNHPDLDAKYPHVKDFYRYYEGCQEGWDGPALLVFSDGHRVGARLDRNGLRPARFWQKSDGTIYVASEVGVLNDVLDSAKEVVSKGRLGPGQMVVADLDSGSFLRNEGVCEAAATDAAYDEWLKASTKTLKDCGASGEPLSECLFSADEALKRQAAAGFGLEDATMVIEGMAQQAIEPTFCMGDDNPLAVLSTMPHMLYTYFKQRFAQVTNPPIDPLREGLVMSLNMRLGARGNILQPGADAYRQLTLSSPVLLETDLSAIQEQDLVATKVMPAFFEAGKEGGLKAALADLCAAAEEAVKGGAGCLIISDRSDSLEEGRVPVPTLLAVGAVHHHLISARLRSDTSIVADTAQCFSTHHIAVLVGYGAHAVCPYMALEACRQWRMSPRTANLIKNGRIPALSIRAAQRNYKKALEKGVLKILSKMGISLLSCYHGAQIFEAYGLGEEVIETSFRGSVSRIGGMSLADLQAEAEDFHAKGFPEKAMSKLEDYGFIQSRPKGEYHSNNGVMSKLLHKAIGLGGNPGNQELYDDYMKHMEKSPVATLRDALELKSGREPIDVSEVEPVEKIMSRFCTGGMSLGAISRETHETIAIAMNRIGGKSNSGEGGEDPERWETLQGTSAEGMNDSLPHLKGLQDGDIATSKIKQVASGRFGVTPHFLVNSDQLEIKIAQGAKPGEGGQLPGKKVSPYIASLRRSKPGVPLISPPPHHDIYSIEDLAQLIYDLHMIAPDARVSVKLVGEAGIGTVASGVAKANADVIQISGHDGGTGASPISSIKHAGGPVEMGVAETHQSLVMNELRDRVLLRADGGLRSGRDVMVMAALGADEYGFGTVAMIATGCVMARVCHTNNCPVGVASQREELRARFPGTPADVVNFFHFVGEEVRAELARLGFRSLDEVVGNADLLVQRENPITKTSSLDLSFITTHAGPVESLSSARCTQPTHSNGPVIDDELLDDSDLLEAIEDGGSVTREASVVNTDRAALARVAGRIAKKWGDASFPGKITFNLRGSGGQSFGAFLVGGMDVTITGEANDYIGKGMAGGTLTILPPPDAAFDPSEASIVGNTCLYGATGGKFFAHGRAGERFAVRNSMCDAVCEGAGDHCCEYMTGGCVVSLGVVGRNVAAGMTGGLGYFYDVDGSFCSKVNPEIVSVQKIVSAAGEAKLKDLLEEYTERTGSVRAKKILDNWETEKDMFWQVVPPSEKETPEASAAVVMESVDEGTPLAEAPVSVGARAA